MTDWARILPDADHRWTMGLRSGNAQEFFARHDATGAMYEERRRWLTEDPQKYAALPIDAETALRDTLQLARSLGTEIDGSRPLWDQMLELGCAWEPDFVWMRRGEDGRHRLIGGVLCFPSSWDLREKLGRPMFEIHAPVPKLNETLERQIETFLTRLAPGAVWTRENANFSRDPLLNHHPARSRKRLDATITAEEFFIRLEHQLLMRLPTCGDILFGIRLEIVPIRDLLDNRAVADRLARMIATISPEAASYKGIADARSALLRILDPPSVHAESEQQIGDHQQSE